MKLIEDLGTVEDLALKFKQQAFEQKCAIAMGQDATIIASEVDQGEHQPPGIEPWVRDVLPLESSRHYMPPWTTHIIRGGRVYTIEPLERQGINASIASIMESPFCTPTDGRTPSGYEERQKIMPLVHDRAYALAWVGCTHVHRVWNHERCATYGGTQ